MDIVRPPAGTKLPAALELSHALQTLTVRSSLPMIREDAQGELLNPAETPSWDTTDRLLTLLLALIAIVFTFRTVHWNTAPSEDSLMLLRYTNHLVSGAGITWNVGDPPVEGATDFLYMVILAGCMKIFHGGAITTSRI